MTELHFTWASVPLALLLLLIATIAFDVIHFLLHRFSQSHFSLLQSIGSLHDVHHDFLDQDLRIHENKITANVFCHVIPEYLIQVLVTLLLGLVVPYEAVFIAITLETIIVLLILKPTPGFDINHKPVDQLKAYKPLYFCLPEYHLMHHVYPNAYFSSWIKTLDRFLGTGISLKGRQITLTGANSGFGKAFFEKLQNENCKVTKITLGESLNKEALNPVLKKTDILVLCHEAQSPLDYQNLIEFFYSLQKDRRIPVEVWAMADVGEFKTSGANSFPHYARQIFASGEIIYRHLVLNQFKHEIDPWSLNRLFKRIKKGYHYVPVRRGIRTLLHYRKFFLK